MFFRLTKKEFKLFVAGVTTPFVEECVITYHEPERLSGFIYLQPILDQRGPTQEETEIYAETLRKALKENGMNKKAIVSVSNMPVHSRFGTDKNTACSSSLVKIQLL